VWAHPFVVPWHGGRGWTECRMPVAGRRAQRHPAARASHDLWISIVAVAAPGAAAPDPGAAVLAAPDFAAVASQCGGGPHVAVGP